MNVEKVKRLSSNNKYENVNIKAKARPPSTRKTNINKNGDLNLHLNNNVKDFSKSKSQFNKYS